MLWDYLGGVVRPNLKVQFWEKHYNRIKNGCNLMEIKLPNLTDLLKQREKILQRSFNQSMSRRYFKTNYNKELVVEGISLKII